MHSDVCTLIWHWYRPDGAFEADVETRGAVDDMLLAGACSDGDADIVDCSILLPGSMHDAWCAGVSGEAAVHEHTHICIVVCSILLPGDARKRFCMHAPELTQQQHRRM